MDVHVEKKKGDDKARPVKKSTELIQRQNEVQVGSDLGKSSYTTASREQ